MYTTDELPDSKFYKDLTIPWSDEELLRYRGFRLCYTARRDGTVIVHFQGGRNVALDEMNRRAVIEPIIWRYATRQKKELAT